MSKKIQMQVEVRAPRPTLEVELDAENGLAYVRLRHGTVARTIEHCPGVLLDVDAKGGLLGIDLHLPVTWATIESVSDRYLRPVADVHMKEAVTTVGQMLAAVPA